MTSPRTTKAQPTVPSGRSLKLRQKSEAVKLLHDVKLWPSKSDHIGEETNQTNFLKIKVQPASFQQTEPTHTRPRHQNVSVHDTDYVKLDINVESSYKDEIAPDEGDVQEEGPSNDTSLVSNETESELFVNETGPLMVLMSRQHMSMISSGRGSSSRSAISSQWPSILLDVQESISRSMKVLSSSSFWPIEANTGKVQNEDSYSSNLWNKSRTMLEGIDLPFGNSKSTSQSVHERLPVYNGMPTIAATASLSHGFSTNIYSTPDFRTSLTPPNERLPETKYPEDLTQKIVPVPTLSGTMIDKNGSKKPIEPLPQLSTVSTPKLKSLDIATGRQFGATLAHETMLANIQTSYSAWSIADTSQTTRQQRQYVDKVEETFTPAKSSVIDLESHPLLPTLKTSELKINGIPTPYPQRNVIEAAPTVSLPTQPFTISSHTPPIQPAKSTSNTPSLAVSASTKLRGISPSASSTHTAESIAPVEKSGFDLTGLGAPEKAIGSMVDRVEVLVSNTTTAAKTFANVTSLVEKLENLVDNEITKRPEGVEERTIKEIVTTQNNATDEKYEGVIDRLNYLTKLVETMENEKHETATGLPVGEAEDERKRQTVEVLNRIVSKLKGHNLSRDVVAKFTSQRGLSIHASTSANVLPVSLAIPTANVNTATAELKTSRQESVNQREERTSVLEKGEGKHTSAILSTQSVFTQAVDKASVDGAGYVEVSKNTISSSSLKETVTTPTNVEAPHSNIVQQRPTHPVENVSQPSTTGSQTRTMQPSTRIEKFNIIAKKCHAGLSFQPGYLLRGGFSAGLFSRYSRIKTLAKCIKKCCSTDTCSVVLMLQGNCFNVRCKNKWLCSKVKNHSKNVKSMLVFVNRGESEVANFPELMSVHGDSDNKQGSFGRTTEAMTRKPTKGISMNHELTKKNFIPTRPDNGAATQVNKGNKASSTMKPTVKNPKQEAYHPSETSMDAVFRPLSKPSDIIAKKAKQQGLASSKVSASDGATQTSSSNTEVSTGAVYHPETLASDLKFGLMVKQLAKNALPQHHNGSLAKTARSDLKCKPNEVQYDTVLANGWKAGEFQRHGDVSHMVDCIQRCCNQPDCHVAMLMVHCYTVHCFDMTSCEPKHPKISFFKPKIAFVRIPPKEGKGSRTNLRRDGTAIQRASSIALKASKRQLFSQSSLPSSSDNSFSVSPTKHLSVLPTPSKPPSPTTNATKDNTPPRPVQPSQNVKAVSFASGLTLPRTKIITSDRTEQLEKDVLKTANVRNKQFPLTTRLKEIPSLSVTASRISDLELLLLKPPILKNEMNIAVQNTQPMQESKTLKVTSVQDTGEVDTSIANRKPSATTSIVRLEPTLTYQQIFSALVNLQGPSESASLKSSNNLKDSNIKTVTVQEPFVSPVAPVDLSLSRQKTPPLSAFGDLGDDMELARLRASVNNELERQRLVDVVHKEKYMEPFTVRTQKPEEGNDPRIAANGKSLSLLEKFLNKHWDSSEENAQFLAKTFDRQSAMIHALPTATLYSTSMKTVSLLSQDRPHNFGNQGESIPKEQQLAIDASFFKSKHDKIDIIEKFEPTAGLQRQREAKPTLKLERTSPSPSVQVMAFQPQSVANLPTEKQHTHIANMATPVAAATGNIPTAKRKELLAEFYATHNFKNIFGNYKSDTESVQNMTHTSEISKYPDANSFSDAKTDSDFSKIFKKVRRIRPSEACAKSQILERSILTLGWKAGQFSDAGPAQSVNECLIKCCSASACNVALFVKGHCFLIKCRYPESCAQTSTNGLDVQPSLAYVPRNENEISVFGSFVRAALKEQRERELNEMDKAQRNSKLLNEALASQQTQPTPPENAVMKLMEAQHVPSKTEESFKEMGPSKANNQRYSTRAVLPSAKVPFASLSVLKTSALTSSTLMSSSPYTANYYKEAETYSTPNIIHQTPMLLASIRPTTSHSAFSVAITSSVAVKSQNSLVPGNKEPLQTQKQTEASSAEAAKFEHLIKLVENLHNDVTSFRPTEAIKQSNEVMKMILSAIRELKSSQNSLLQNLSDKAKKSEIFHRVLNDTSQDDKEPPRLDSSSKMNQEILNVLHEISIKLHERHQNVGVNASHVVGMKVGNSLGMLPYRVTENLVETTLGHQIQTVSKLFIASSTEALRTSIQAKEGHDTHDYVPTPPQLEEVHPLVGIREEINKQRKIDKENGLLSASVRTSEIDLMMTSKGIRTMTDVSSTKKVAPTATLALAATVNALPMEIKPRDKVTNLLGHIDQLLNYTNVIEKTLLMAGRHENKTKAELHGIINREISKLNITKVMHNLGEKLERLKDVRHEENKEAIMKPFVELLKSAIQNVSRNNAVPQESKLRVAAPLFATDSNSGDNSMDTADDGILLDILNDMQSSYYEEMQKTVSLSKISPSRNVLQTTASNDSLPQYDIFQQLLSIAQLQKMSTNPQLIRSSILPVQPIESNYELEKKSEHRHHLTEMINIHKTRARNDATATYFSLKPTPNPVKVFQVEKNADPHKISPVHDEIDFQTELDYLMPKPECKHTEPLTNQTFKHGVSAGTFKQIGTVKNMKSCIASCCKDTLCDAAFMLQSHCVIVYCNSKSTCETTTAKKSSLNPMISFVIRKAPVQFESTMAKSSFTKVKGGTVDMPILPTVGPELNQRTSKIPQQNLPAFYSVPSLSPITLIEPSPSKTLHKPFIGTKLVDDFRNQVPLSSRSKKFGQDVHSNLVNMTDNIFTDGAGHIAKAPLDQNGSFGPQFWLHNTDRSKANVSAGQTGEIPQSFPEGMLLVESPRNLPLCSYSPISYNVTLRHGLESGYHMGSVSTEECSHLCCQSPGCDVAFMLNGSCYTVNCQNKTMCELIGSEALHAATNIVFVTKIKPTHSDIDSQRVAHANIDNGSSRPVNGTIKPSPARGSRLFQLHSVYNDSIPAQKRERVANDEELTEWFLMNRSTAENQTNTTPRVLDIGDEVNNYIPTARFGQENVQETAKGSNATARKGTNISDLVTEYPVFNEGLYDKGQGFNDLGDIEMQMLKMNTSDNDGKQGIPKDTMNFTESNRKGAGMIGNLKENAENVRKFEAEFDAIADAADSADAVAGNTSKSDRRSSDKADISMEVLKVPTKGYDRSSYENADIDAERGMIRSDSGIPAGTTDLMQQNMGNDKKELLGSSIADVLPETAMNLQPEDAPEVAGDIPEVTSTQLPNETMENEENLLNLKQGIDAAYSEMNNQKEDADLMTKIWQMESEEGQKMPSDDLKLLRDIIQKTDEVNSEEGRSSSERHPQELENPAIESEAWIPKLTKESSYEDGRESMKEHFEDDIDKYEKEKKVDFKDEQGYGRSAVRTGEETKSEIEEKGSSFVSHSGKGNTFIVSEETKEKHSCEPREIKHDIIFAHGSKGKQIKELGSVNGMLTCIELCCISDKRCDAVLLLDNACYSVVCENETACDTVRSKSLDYKASIAYIKGHSGKSDASQYYSGTKPMNVERVNEDSKNRSNVDGCMKYSFETGIMKSGFNAGEITRHGIVQNETECLKYCCDDKKCNVAFLLKKHCYSVTCNDAYDCVIEHMKESWYSPRIALVRGIIDSGKNHTETRIVKKTDIPQPEDMSHFLEDKVLGIQKVDSEAVGVPSKSALSTTHHPHRGDLADAIENGRSRSADLNMAKHVPESKSYVRDSQPNRESDLGDAHGAVIDSVFDKVISNHANEKDVKSIVGHGEDNLMKMGVKKSKSPEGARPTLAMRHKTMEDTPFSSDFGSLGSASDLQKIKAALESVDTVESPKDSNQMDVSDKESKVDDIGSEHGYQSRRKEEMKMLEDEKSKEQRRLENEKKLKEEKVKAELRLEEEQKAMEERRLEEKQRLKKEKRLKEEKRLREEKKLKEMQRLQKYQTKLEKLLGVKIRKQKSEQQSLMKENLKDQLIRKEKPKFNKDYDDEDNDDAADVGDLSHGSLGHDGTESESKILHRKKQVKEDDYEDTNDIFAKSDGGISEKERSYVNDLGDEREEMNEGNNNGFVVHDDNGEDEGNHDSYVSAKRKHRRHHQRTFNNIDESENEIEEAPLRGKHLHSGSNDHRHSDEELQDETDDNDNYDFVMPHRSRFQDEIKRRKHLKNGPFVIIPSADHVLSDTKFKKKKLKQRKPFVVMPKDDYDELNFYREISQLTGESKKDDDDELPDDGSLPIAIAKKHDDINEPYELVDPDDEKTDLGMLMRRPKLVVSEPVHDDATSKQDNVLFIDKANRENAVSAIHEGENTQDYPFVIIRRKPKRHRTLLPWQLRHELEDDIFGDGVLTGKMGALKSRIGVLGDENPNQKLEKGTAAPVKNTPTRKKTPSRPKPTRKPTAFNPSIGPGRGVTQQKPIILSINVETFPGQPNARRRTDQNMEIRKLTTARPLLELNLGATRNVRTRNPTKMFSKSKPTKVIKPTRKIPKQNTATKHPGKLVTPSKRKKTPSKIQSHVDVTTRRPTHHSTVASKQRSGTDKIYGNKDDSRLGNSNGMLKFFR